MSIIRLRNLALLLAAVVFLLCACAKQEAAQVYTVSRYGRTYTVDQEAHTVTYQGITYHFSISTGSGRGYSVTFTAPDGSTAWWDSSNNVGSGGWSDNWDENVWPSDLADAVVQPSARPRERQGNPLVGLLLITVGAFNVLAPETSWYLSHGWKYKDAEPSDAALGLGRAGGVFSILLGLVLCIV